MRAVTILLAVVLVMAAGCDALTTIDYGKDDGVQPIIYSDTLVGLPASFTPAEWPDGEAVLEGPTGDVFLVVSTNPDGSRDVTLRREVILLSAADAMWFHTQLGGDRIRAIRAVHLELDKLELDGVDPAMTARARVAADDVTLPSDGSRTTMKPDMLAMLRGNLLHDQEVDVELSITFHLTIDQLGALPPHRLHLELEVQPTITVDILDAL